MKQQKCVNPDLGKEGHVLVPMTDWLGRSLPMGRTKANRRVRLRHYVISGLIGGLAYALLDVILMGFVEETVLTGQLFPSLNRLFNILILAAIVFVVVFLGVFLFQYLTGECVKVRRYERFTVQPK